VPGDGLCCALWIRLMQGAAWFCHSWRFGVRKWQGLDP
jgi:hypothetical protein